LPVITLRQASVDDVAFLREMLYLALFVPPGSPPYARSILDDPAIDHYVRDWGTRPGDYGVIANVDGAPRGAAWLRYFATDARGYGFVNETTPELTVAVMRAYRNQGIGAQLVTHLQEHASGISLSCDPANPAWRFYRRAGFEPMPDGRTLLWAGPR
jgi:ribosomal protein S18 acetylase RimI-like enzyme